MKAPTPHPGTERPTTPRNPKASGGLRPAAPAGRAARLGRARLAKRLDGARGRVVAVAAGVLILGAGCQAVEPWQRERLADYVMRPDRDPLRVSLQEHMWSSREAATGGERVGGGGCGCN